MTAPRVAVIVVLHDSARYVERCLTALLAAGGPPAEIVVVDNASVDDGPERVRRGFPGVRLVRAGLNGGFAAGINLGVAATSAPLVAPLNVDTEVEGDWLSPLVAHLDAHPEVGAVTPMLLVDQDRGRVNALGGAIHPSGLSFCNGLGLARGEVPPSPFLVPGVSGAAYVVRRALLDAMGGAPEFCFMGNDDVVLSWTLRMMGAQLACVPASVVHHRYNLTLDAEKLYLVERNRLIHLLTALQASTLSRRAPALLALEALIFLYCGVRGPSFVAAKARAVRDALGRPAFLRARRAQLSALRRVGDDEIFRGLSPALQWDQLARLLGRGRPREESVGSAG